MNNSTTTFPNMVKTAAAVSIKNHLRAAAEKNLEIIRHLHDRSRKDILTEPAAKQMAARIMLGQTIGASGYLDCLDSNGKVTVHPQAALIDSDVFTFAFVREQLGKKIGYIENDWNNPDEARSRPKVLYMLYFEPWDWIVSGEVKTGSIIYPNDGIRLRT